MRTVITFDPTPPPDEIKVKLCGGNHVEPGEQIVIKNGETTLGTRWVSEVCDGYYLASASIPIKERNWTIVYLHNRGYTNTHIGKMFDLSHQRIHQILKEAVSP